MRRTSSLLLAALTLLVGAVFGVHFSGATWTDSAPRPVEASAFPDWMPPKVTVTAGAALRGTATVTVTATDDRSAITSVVLSRSADGHTWTPLTSGCTTPSGPSPLTYSCSWNTTALADGDYQLRATATDAYGHSATSSTTSVQVVNSPAVVLTPVPGLVRGSVSLTATFHHPANSPANLFVDYRSGATWTPIGGCTATSVRTVTCSWNTTSVADNSFGTFDLRARAEFDRGTYVDQQFGVVVDNQAPTVALEVPAGQLSGAASLSATAGGTGSAVASVRFEHQRQGTSGWTTCDTDTTAPYACALDTRSLANGTYLFRAVATDAAGNTATTATQSRQVSNVAAVTITRPVGGSTVGGTVGVETSAFSPLGIVSVRIESRTAGGAFSTVCTDTTTPYGCAWDVAALSGAHELRAVLTQTGGTTVTSGIVAVTVDNSAGAATITSPAAGATVSGTATVSVATYSPSSTTGVTIEGRPRAGGSFTSLCTATLVGSSWRCSWDSRTAPSPYGDYELRAVMTQADGPQVTSPVVTVALDNVVGSVAVTSPAPGHVRGSVTVRASASSNAGVASVRLETRSAAGTFTTLCTATAAPYSCTWNTASTAYGAYEIRAVMTQGNGADVTSPVVAVAVDNRTLRGADVEAIAAGGGDGPSVGDRLFFTYDGIVDLSTLKPGFTGASTPINVTLTAGPTGNAFDVMTFPGTGIGTLDTGSKAIKSGSAAFAGSTMTATQATLNGAPVTVVTVTLGTADYDQTGSGSLRQPATMVWTPSGAVKDPFGVACATTPVSEADATQDMDF